MSASTHEYTATQLLAQLAAHRPSERPRTDPNTTPAKPYDLGTRVRIGEEGPTPASEDTILQRIEALETANRDLKRDNLIMRDTQQEIMQENAELRRMLEQLLATPTVNGTFPAAAEIESLSCQVWHTPGLTTAQKRGKSEWSLRFEYVRHGHRQVVNVALFPHPRLLTTVRDQQAEATIVELAEAGIGVDTWGGLVRRKSSLGTGRGNYVNSQAAFMSGHTRGREFVHVVLLIDGHLLEITNFVNSRQVGSKPASKWIGFLRGIS